MSVQPNIIKTGTGANIFALANEVGNVAQTLEYRTDPGNPGGQAAGTMTFYPRGMNWSVPKLNQDGTSNEIPGFSLDQDGKTIHCPPGVYLINGFCSGLMTVVQARLYSVTDDNTLILGSSVGNDTRTVSSTFSGTINLAKRTDLQVQFAGAISAGVQDYGQASNFSEQNVFLQITFTQIAPSQFTAVHSIPPVQQTQILGDPSSN